MKGRTRISLRSEQRRVQPFGMPFGHERFGWLTAASTVE